MKIDNAVALVTGANRGIGLAFARALLARGARKVSAGAARAGDVTLLINNAGIGMPGGFLAPDSEEAARRQFETNFFGMLRMSRAFAPVLAANGGGALLNVLSTVSWINGGTLAAYAASKSAAWSLTNALRYELAAQRTQVTALHMAFVDTDMVRAIDAQKSSAADIVARALEGVEAGADEVIADDPTRHVKASLSATHPAYLPQRAA